MADQKPAVSFRIGEHDFVTHMYSASQALDILLSLGDVIAVPLSKMLGKDVTGDLNEISAAVGEIQNKDIDMSAMLSVFGAIRKAGGVSLVVSLLQTTYHEDQPIDSVKRFDQVFHGSAGLVVAAQLLWRVLVYQLSPLLTELSPLLSAERLTALSDLSRKISGQM